MTFLLQRFHLTCLLFCISSLLILVSSRGQVYNPPSVEQLTDRFHPTSVAEKLSTYYGASNIRTKNNGSYTDIILDKSSGSGLVSKDRYHHGFFSAAIKLPMGVTSGVVLAFYMFFHTTMMRLTLNCLGMRREKNGFFKQIFMGMEVSKLEEKKSFTFGLILLKSFINIACYGTSIT